MENLRKEQKTEMLDCFGKMIINEVRDNALQISMDIAKMKTKNPIKLKQYAALGTLTQEQQEIICDLLSETITDTIYRLLEMIEDNPDKVSLIIKSNGQAFDVVDLSEKMGSEIACYENNGWIQKFSKLGRFVL